jgi:hypothetical protein
MIISHKHKFIFIKTVKTAGTSLEVFLSQHCGPDDLLTPFDSPIERHQPRNYEGSANPAFEILRLPFGPRSAWQSLRADRRRFYNHMPAWIVRLRVPPGVWNSYFKFCVERNPWDKVLSHYHMHAYRLGGDLSLDQYFTRGKFPINYPRYTDPSGSRIIVDRVVRYENLTDELGEIFARLKVPFKGSLGVRKKVISEPIARHISRYSVRSNARLWNEYLPEKSNFTATVSNKFLTLNPRVGQG